MKKIYVPSYLKWDSIFYLFWNDHKEVYPDLFRKLSITSKHAELIFKVPPEDFESYVTRSIKKIQQLEDPVQGIDTLIVYQKNTWFQKLCDWMRIG